MSVDVRLRGGDLATADTNAVALPLLPGKETPVVGSGRETAAALGVDLDAVLMRESAKAEAGEVLRIPLYSGAVRAIYLVGVGDASPRSLRKAGAGLARRAKDEAVVAIAIRSDRADAGLSALVEGLVLASYRFRAAGAEPKGWQTERFELVTEAPKERQPVLDRTLAVVRAGLRARDLTNTPSLLKSPQWLAEQATAIAAGGGLGIRVRDEKALVAEGFGGILAVGMGSTRPPRLIELTWTPRGAKRHVVLVGKGITFDSGGLSLKPNDGMVSMKTDMAGGAAVMAAMGAVRDLGVRVKVTGLVPAAENLPSGTAQRPGDVITHYGGRTSEVLNTDAEGRLVLADALAYATARLRPDVVVDLATLTGAASLGLGRRHAALYATTDALAAELTEAADRAGERVWRMPLAEDYAFALRSRVADLANIATDKRVSGGSIVAALFLSEFVDGCPWAHLDIAGPARSDGDEDEVTKGATGFGARLLLRWLEKMG